MVPTDVHYRDLAVQVNVDADYPLCADEYRHVQEVRNGGGAWPFITLWKGAGDHWRGVGYHQTLADALHYQDSYSKSYPYGMTVTRYCGARRIVTVSEVKPCAPTTR
jgi:hypothetical protein